ncbi:RNA-binding S4 domain-containing protein [Clostridium grantii]|uniref:RQC P-site tRNA stabilizing factor n=1 Tax=Clostridium grantii DSM 8605 TaxID=1121316 RepID=A0A1M5XAX6_9CLOT|nr:RNA-binding S4 domain-containing protein [Clostridium grantii]SHH96353.1 Ribosomal 50S subunit-recycling heat shock protein, contains S4 domain [Clostridium grantii DSM 8605]
MRLDKYLKISRMIKRRTIAKEACISGRVLINGKIAKASTEVKENDIIEISFAKSSLKAKVLNIATHVSKEDARNLYEIILDSEENI